MKTGSVNVHLEWVPGSEVGEQSSLGLYIFLPNGAEVAPTSWINCMVWIQLQWNASAGGTKKFKACNQDRDLSGPILACQSCTYIIWKEINTTLWLESIPWTSVHTSAQREDRVVWCQASAVHRNTSMSVPLDSPFTASRYYKLQHISPELSRQEKVQNVVLLGIPSVSISSVKMRSYQMN